MNKEDEAFMKIASRDMFTANWIMTPIVIIIAITFFYIIYINIKYI